MPTRRTILKAISSVALCSLAVPKAADTRDLDALCLQLAREMGETMSAKHGGVWRVSINENFVLISKSLVNQPSTER
jgi:hypothetical protein